MKNEEYREKIDKALLERDLLTTLIIEKKREMVEKEVHNGL